MDAAERHRLAEFSRCHREFFQSMTPLDRDCLFKIHMQEALGEPIDPAAYKLVHDKLDAHNERWRERNASKRGPRHWYVL